MKTVVWKVLAGLGLALHWVALAFAAEPLLEPEALEALLEQPQVRVVDIRPFGNFAAGHIPGAVNAPYDRWRSPERNPGVVPPLADLVALVQELGLTADSHVVVTSSGKDSSDFGAMARVYWTLKSLGLSALSIANGGMQEWEQALGPLSTTPQPVAPSTFVPQWSSRWLLTREEVRQRLDAGLVQSGQMLLLDARPKAFYLGEQQVAAALLAGTLPGAVQHDFGQWFAPGSSQFVAPAQAAQVASQVLKLEQPPAETVTFCNAGHWSATEWFALSEVLGVPGVRMYAGSMVDWSQSPEMPPMANMPSRGQQLLRATQQWWARIWP